MSDPLPPPRPPWQGDGDPEPRAPAPLPGPPPAGLPTAAAPSVVAPDRPPRMRPTPGAPRVSKDRNSRRIANYVIGALLLIVVAIVALVVVRSLGEDDGGGLTILTLDVRSGEVALVDTDGQPIDDAPSIDGSDLQPFVSETRDQYVLAPGDDDAWQVIDIVEGDVRTIQPPSDDAAAAVVRWAHERLPVTVSFDQDLGNIVLTDVATGDVIDVGAEGDLDEPLMNGAAVLSTEDGSVYGVTDIREVPLTTVLVGFGRESVIVPGQLVGLDEDGAAVLERDRTSQRLVFHDLAGEEQSTVDLPRSVHASMGDDGTVVVIGEDGSVGRASRDEEELDQLDPIDIGNGEIAQVVRFGDRLVVTTDRNTVTVIDEGGETLLAQRGEVDPRTFGAVTPGPRSGAGCLLVAEGRETSRQYDLETGDELTSEPLRGPVLAVSTDRCGVSTGDGVTVRGEPVGEAGETLRATSPDGEIVVTGTRRGELLLRRLDDPEAEPIELPGQAVVFAER